MRPGNYTSTPTDVWANENLDVDTCTRESNSGPYDCEPNALPHDLTKAILIPGSLKPGIVWLTLSQTSPGF